MTKQLLIVFVKNILLGKVKTRLAKTIGNQAAFEVYKTLVAITETATQKLTIDQHIYFSDSIIESKWSSSVKKVQQGNDLGERMKNAFIDGFNLGYENIVLIGSDLPNINKTIILNGFNALKTHSTTFGPALDGGYYLIGLNKIHPYIFENMPWSQPNLLKTTLNTLNNHNVTYRLLETLNDVDTYDDLINSDFYKNDLNLQMKIKQLNDKTNK